MPAFRPFRHKNKAARKAGYGSKDAKVWQRLVKAVRVAVRAPLADTKPLWTAALACTKAVPPPAHAGRDSIFLRLSLNARAYAGLQPQQRETAHGERQALCAMADACDAILNKPPSPPGQGRADIFG